MAYTFSNDGHDVNSNQRYDNIDDAINGAKLWLESSGKSARVYIYYIKEKTLDSGMKQTITKKMDLFIEKH